MNIFQPCRRDPYRRLYPLSVHTSAAYIFPLCTSNMSRSAVPRHGQRTTEEASAAGSEAFKGAVVGAAKVSTPPPPEVLSIIFLRLLSFFFTLLVSDSGCH